jgi:hypothetical protein
VSFFSFPNQTPSQGLTRAQKNFFWLTGFFTVPENIKKIGANDIKHEKTFNSQFLFRRE